MALCLPAVLFMFCWMVSDGEDSFFLKWVANAMSTSSLIVIEVTVLGTFALFVIAALAFALRPWWRKKLAKNDGISRTANLIIAICVSGTLLYLPSQAMAGQQATKKVAISLEKSGKVVAIDKAALASLTAENRQAVDTAVNAALARFPAGFDRSGDVYKIETRVAIGTCIIIVVVIVAVGAGGYYIYVKIREFCAGLNKNVKQKQEDPDETNSTKSVMFKLLGKSVADGPTEYAASFCSTKSVPLPPLVDPNCGCYTSAPALVILEYTVSQEIVAGGSLIPITVHRPKRLIDEDEFLIRHGLGTNNDMSTYYSVSRDPTPEPLKEITFDQNLGAIAVTLGTSSTITTEIMWSTNLVNWEALPFSRMSVSLSSGSDVVRIVMEDALASYRVPKKYYKVQIIK